MTNQNFSDEFDVLFNNISSNLGPGLDEYEKSVFLTKGQDEVLKAYYDMRGNKYQQGFDGSPRRQIDFSMLTKVWNFKEKTTETLDRQEADFRATEEGETTTTDVLHFELIKDDKPVVVRVKTDYYQLDLGQDPRTAVSVEDLASEVKIIINIFGYLNEAPLSWKSFAEFIHNGDEFSEVGLYINITSNVEASIMDYEMPSTSFIVTLQKGGTSTNIKLALFDTHDNALSLELPKDILMCINEMVKVKRYSKDTLLQILPITFDEYTRLMSKPFKRPLKNQAWRLLDSDTANKADLILGYNDEFKEYILRYIKKPRPIILTPLEGVTIDGWAGCDDEGNLVTENATQGSECELDKILHEEILQRAVELAKAAYTGDLSSLIALGQNSETNMGIVSTSSNNK